MARFGVTALAEGFVRLDCPIIQSAIGACQERHAGRHGVNRLGGAIPDNDNNVADNCQREFRKHQYRVPVSKIDACSVNKVKASFYRATGPRAIKLVTYSRLVTCSSPPPQSDNQAIDNPSAPEKSPVTRILLLAQIILDIGGSALASLTNIDRVQNYLVAQDSLSNWFTKN